MADSIRDIPVATTPEERQRAVDFLRSVTPEQRSGAPLYEYIGQQDPKAVNEPRYAYAMAVLDSLTRPVISTAYAAQALNDESVAERYPNGYMSVRDFTNERADAAYTSYIKRVVALGQKVTPQHAAMAQQRRDSVLSAADDAEGILAGTLKTDSKFANGVANDIRQAVAAHAPGGEYAKFAGRTESEEQQAQLMYGPEAKFMLTGAGRQNHEAQRLLDLWSATDENYGPATTPSQVQRFVGGLTAPIYNTIVGNSNRLMGEQWYEMGQISQPDGKYGYAAEMYRRGAGESPGSPASTYTPEGRAKYISAEMTAPEGLANATSLNASYPLANWNQSVIMRVKQIPTTIGNALAGGDTNFADNVTGLRLAYNRTTPVVPDGADPQEFDRIGKQLQSADNRMSGWNSAQLGPKIADAYNATIGQVAGKMDRFYLPPVVEDAMELPIEAVTDPVNIAMNAAMPGSGALLKTARSGAKAGGSHLIRSLAKVPARMGDDMAEETIQGVGLNSAISGWSDYFFPSKTNMLMGNADPNAPGYDDQLREKGTQARQDQIDAASAYGKMIGKKPQSDPMAARLNEPIGKPTLIPHLLIPR